MTIDSDVLLKPSSKIIRSRKRKSQHDNDDEDYAPEPSDSPSHLNRNSASHRSPLGNLDLNGPTHNPDTMSDKCSEEKQDGPVKKKYKVSY
jgi:hypothetical protein